MTGPMSDVRRVRSLRRAVPRAWLPVALLALVLAQAASAQPAAQAVDVKATKSDGGYVVDANFTVAADADLVWEVLTAFGDMSKILSSVDASKIVNRTGNTFDVEQQGHATAGPVKLSLNSVRHIDLTPKTEIKSQLTSGDNLKSSVFTTRIVAQGANTRVNVRGTFEPTWLAGTVITVSEVEAQTRRQYSELRAEILRRKNGEPTPPCILKKDCP